jgi:hypothetical protein
MDSKRTDRRDEKAALWLRTISLKLRPPIQLGLSLCPHFGLGLPQAPSLWLRAFPLCQSASACIGEMAQKVWTSQHALDGLEFCSMFNSLVRGDCNHDDELADQVARLAHPINGNMVTCGVGGVFPWHGPTAGANHNSTERDTRWRGGGFQASGPSSFLFEVVRVHWSPTPQGKTTSDAITLWWWMGGGGGGGGGQNTQK